MKKAISFLSESSIGLSIAPIVKEWLNEEYKYVTPIAPWMTREGSTISKYIHRDDKFKIFGIYPRRPKLHFENEDIEIKISSRIIASAKKSIESGVPIIAGCPLVRNFWELSDNPDYLWLKLDTYTNDDLYFSINKSHDFSPMLSSIQLKGKREILTYIRNNAKEHNIYEALMIFRENNISNMFPEYYHSFVFGGSYKPIYFLLKE